MMRAVVVTPYLGNGSAMDPYRPKVAEVYPLAEWGDVTGQARGGQGKEVNAYTIEALLDSPVLTALEADDGYVVWWSEETT